MVNSQPGDRLDRLRHLRPAVLRAADARGRAEHRRRAIEPAGHHRAVRRPDAAQPRARPARRRRAAHRHLASSRSTAPRTASCSRKLLDEARPRPAAERHGARPSSEALRGRATASATRCWCGPSYVLGGRAMEIVYDDDGARPLHGRTRSQASPDRPVLVDKFLEDAIEVDVDAISDGETRRDRRHHGAHRGGRHPLRRLELLAAAAHARPTACIDEIARGHDGAWRASCGVDRPDERAVRGQGPTALRARGQPARLAHGAVRQQGDRRAAGQARRAR